MNDVARRQLTEAVLPALQRHLARLAAATVMPIPGMYTATPDGAALLGDYRKRPIDVAYEIIETQMVYPKCLMCELPVVGGKLHDDVDCVDDRKRGDCRSNNSPLRVGYSLDVPSLCLLCSDHRVASTTTPVCDCCQESFVNNDAKMAFLARLTEQALNDRLRKLTRAFVATVGESPVCFAAAEAAEEVTDTWPYCTAGECRHLCEPGSTDSTGKCRCCA